jgi:hypothetical protein
MRRLSAVYEDVKVEMKPDVEGQYRFVDTERERRRPNLLN